MRGEVDPETDRALAAVGEEAAVTQRAIAAEKLGAANHDRFPAPVTTDSRSTVRHAASGFEIAGTAGHRRGRFVLLLQRGVPSACEPGYRAGMRKMWPAIAVAVVFGGGVGSLVTWLAIHAGGDRDWWCEPPNFKNDRCYATQRRCDRATGGEACAKATRPVYCYEWDSDPNVIDFCYSNEVACGTSFAMPIQTGRLISDGCHAGDHADVAHRETR